MTAPRVPVRTAEHSVAASGNASLATAQSPQFDAHHNSIYAPTAAVYASIEAGLEFLNRRLFGGALRKCVVTLDHRRNRAGYFCPGCFGDHEGNVVHEVSLNANYFPFRPLEETVSTMAHELTHQWREDYGPVNRKGSKGKRGYHDRVWGQKALSIGLLPTHNGRPGGRQIGYRMSHLIIPGGPFDLVAKELIASGYTIDWFGRRYLASGLEAPKPASVSSGKRTRFTCPACNLNAWSRPSAQLRCESCSATMHRSEPQRRAAPRVISPEAW